MYFVEGVSVWRILSGVLFVIFVGFFGVTFSQTQDTTVRQGPLISIDTCSPGQYAQINKDGLICTFASSVTAPECAAGVDCCGAEEFVKITPQGLECFPIDEGGLSVCDDPDDPNDDASKPSCNDCPAGGCCAPDTFATVGPEGLECVQYLVWVTKSLSIPERSTAVLYNFFDPTSDIRVFGSRPISFLTILPLPSEPTGIEFSLSSSIPPIDQSQRNILSITTPSVSRTTPTDVPLQIEASNVVAGIDNSVTGFVNIRVLKSCSGDQDCDLRSACVDSVCTPLIPSGDSCSSDDQCITGSCEEGICSCVVDGDCSGNEDCVNGQCILLECGTCNAVCPSNLQCGNTHTVTAICSVSGNLCGVDCKGAYCPSGSCKNEQCTTPTPTCTYRAPQQSYGTCQSADCGLTRYQYGTCTEGVATNCSSIPCSGPDRLSCGTGTDCPSGSCKSDGQCTTSTPTCTYQTPQQSYGTCQSADCGSTRYQYRTCTEGVATDCSSISCSDPVRRSCGTGTDCPQGQSCVNNISCVDDPDNDDGGDNGNNNNGDSGNDDGGDSNDGGNDGNNDDGDSGNDDGGDSNDGGNDGNNNNGDSGNDDGGDSNDGGNNGGNNDDGGNNDNPRPIIICGKCNLDPDGECSASGIEGFNECPGRCSESNAECTEFVPKPKDPEDTVECGCSYIYGLSDAQGFYSNCDDELTFCGARHFHCSNGSCTDCRNSSCSDEKPPEGNSEPKKTCGCSSVINSDGFATSFSVICDLGGLPPKLEEESCPHGCSDGACLSQSDGEYVCELGECLVAANGVGYKSKNCYCSPLGSDCQYDQAVFDSVLPLEVCEGEDEEVDCSNARCTRWSSTWSPASSTQCAFTQTRSCEKPSPSECSDSLVDSQEIDRCEEEGEEEGCGTCDCTPTLLDFDTDGVCSNSGASCTTTHTCTTGTCGTCNCTSATNDAASAGTCSETGLDCNTASGCSTTEDEDGDEEEGAGAADEQPIVVPGPSYPSYGPSYPSYPSYGPSYPSYPSYGPSYPSYPSYGPSYPSYPSYGPSYPSYPSYGPSYPSYPSYGPSYPSYPSYGPSYPSYPSYGPSYPSYPSYGPSYPSYPSYGPSYPSYPSYGPSYPSYPSYGPSYPSYPSYGPSYPSYPSYGPSYPSYPSYGPSYPSYPSYGPSYPSYPSYGPSYPSYPSYGPSYPSYPSYGPSYPSYPSYGPSYPSYPSYGPSYPSYPSYGPSYPSYPSYGPSYPSYPSYGPSYPSYGPSYPSYGSSSTCVWFECCGVTVEC